MWRRLTVILAVTFGVFVAVPSAEASGFGSACPTLTSAIRVTPDALVLSAAAFCRTTAARSLEVCVFDAAAADTPLACIGTATYTGRWFMVRGECAVEGGFSGTRSYRMDATLRRADGSIAARTTTEPEVLPALC